MRRPVRIKAPDGRMFGRTCELRDGEIVFVDETALVVPINSCAAPRPLKWPMILDTPEHRPALRICETCPNFSVRRDGCPQCSLFKGCAKMGRYGDAIIRREWPEGCPQRDQPRIAVTAK